MHCCKVRYYAFDVADTHPSTVVTLETWNSAVYKLIQDYLTKFWNNGGLSPNLPSHIKAIPRRWSSLLDDASEKLFSFDFIQPVSSSFNHLSTNPIKWSNTQTIRRQFADELFEYVWQRERDQWHKMGNCSKNYFNIVIVIMLILIYFIT